MLKTKAAIVNASDLPLSIIIIGVGNDDFEKMDELDSDNKLLMDNNGRVAKRDIVQFVPFRNFMSQSNAYMSEHEREKVKARLAKEVLEEVPYQVTSYMKSHNISARQPIQMPRGSLDSAHDLPQQNYFEPPPAYSATFDDQFVKQPPLNPAF